MSKGNSVGDAVNAYLISSGDSPSRDSSRAWDYERTTSQCWKCGSRNHKDIINYDVIDCTCRKCGATWRDKASEPCLSDEDYSFDEEPE